MEYAQDKGITHVTHKWGKMEEDGKDREPDGYKRKVPIYLKPYLSETHIYLGFR